MNSKNVQVKCYGKDRIYQIQKQAVFVLAVWVFTIVFVILMDKWV